MPASQCILWIFRSCWIAIKRFNHVPYILYCVTLIIIIEFNYEWDAICELSANNDRLALETVWNLFEGNFLSFEYLNTITDLVRTHLHTHTYFVWLDEVNFWVQITKWFVVRNGLFCFFSALFPTPKDTGLWLDVSPHSRTTTNQLFLLHIKLYGITLIEIWRKAKRDEERKLKFQIS